MGVSACWQNGEGSLVGGNHIRKEQKEVSRALFWALGKQGEALQFPGFKETLLLHMVTKAKYPICGNGFEERGQILRSKERVQLLGMASKVRIGQQ